MGIDVDGVSPVLLRKVVYAGSNNPSFGRAAHDLHVLAEVTVAVKQVERWTKRIGQERHEERDAATAAWLERPLMQREEPPADVALASLAVVEMDGGRLQIRSLSAEKDEGSAAAEQGIAAGVTSPTAAEPSPTAAEPSPTAAEPSPKAARDAAKRATTGKHWREDKVGCLLTMSSDIYLVDPCPQIPAVFVDPLQSLKLAQQVGHAAVPAAAPFAKAQAEGEETSAAKFWSEAGAEALLELRADYLSDEDVLAGFWQRRQAAATGQRRYRRSA